MLKPSSKLWDICILDGESLETTADVQQFAIQYPHLEHAKAPGPLFRCLVMHVEETNSAAVVMYCKCKWRSFNKGKSKLLLTLWLFL